MTKFVLSRLRPAALTTLGWLSFVAGVLIEPTMIKLALLGVARVLPQALQPLCKSKLDYWLMPA